MFNSKINTTEEDKIQKLLEYKAPENINNEEFVDDYLGYLEYKKANAEALKKAEELRRKEALEKKEALKKAEELRRKEALERADKLRKLKQPLFDWLFKNKEHIPEGAYIVCKFEISYLAFDIVDKYIKKFSWEHVRKGYNLLMKDIRLKIEKVPYGSQQDLNQHEKLNKLYSDCLLDYEKSKEEIVAEAVKTIDYNEYSYLVCGFVHLVRRIDSFKKI